MVKIIVSCSALYLPGTPSHAAVCDSQTSAGHSQSAAAKIKPNDRN